MSRKLLGVIAVVLLALGAFVAFAGPGGSSANGFAGGCIRVGLVLGALWLALPQIRAMFARLPGWALGWFVGKGKPGESPTKTDAPVKRERRPRRRGTR